MQNDTDQVLSRQHARVAAAVMATTASNDLQLMMSEMWLPLIRDIQSECKEKQKQSVMSLYKVYDAVIWLT